MIMAIIVGIRSAELIMRALVWRMLFRHSRGRRVQRIGLFHAGTVFVGMAFTMGLGHRHYAQTVAVNKFATVPCRR